MFRLWVREASTSSTLDLGSISAQGGKAHGSRGLPLGLALGT